MRTKISIDLPTREHLIAGLTPRDCHPPLARAESAVVDAERVLEQRRSALAHAKGAVVSVTARVQSGHMGATALTDALRERDAASILIAAAEQSVADARARVAAAQPAAHEALKREIFRRVEVLERTAREIEPVLVELHALSIAIGRAYDPATYGLSTITWPCSTACEISSRGFAAGRPR